MTCLFIRRRLREAGPHYGSVFLRPLISAAVMGAAAWAVYGLSARVLHIGALRAAGSPFRMQMLLALGLAIAAAVAVYLVMAIITRSITLADMKLIPKGEKLARLLHIR